MNRLLTREEFDQDFKDAFEKVYTEVTGISAHKDARLTESQFRKAARLAWFQPPKRPGELNSEYARRLYLAQLR